MKIIDLLNKIANGEEVPKKIKRANMVYEYSQRDEDYINKYDVSFMGTIYCSQEDLNKEIEILDDEEKGLPEKITMRAALVGDIDNKIESLDINIMAVEDKLNEIIDYLEKQRKGDE